MENIISRIDRIATENPDRIAYDYLGRTNTYGELKEKSDALAAYLKASNLPEKAPLIVFGGQDFQMIATFLGIVKSGRAYIPVDVHSSEDRVKVIEEIARPAACIALSELPETGREVPVISRERLGSNEGSRRFIRRLCRSRCFRRSHCCAWLRYRRFDQTARCI